MALGYTQFLLLCAGLTVVGLAAWVVFRPAFYLHDCEHRYIPSMEARFGFHAERITVPGLDHQLFAVTAVEPGRSFARAGFLVGDIPVDHHGGLARLCGALKYAEEGGEPDVTVVNVANWGEPRSARRLRLNGKP